MIIHAIYNIISITGFQENDFKNIFSVEVCV